MVLYTLFKLAVQAELLKTKYYINGKCHRTNEIFSQVTLEEKLGLGC